MKPAPHSEHNISKQALPKGGKRKRWKRHGVGDGMFPPVIASTQRAHYPPFPMPLERVLRGAG